MGVLCWSLFWHALLCVLSSLPSSWRELIALLFCLSDVVPWVGLQRVFVVFPDHIHVLNNFS